MIGDCVEVNYPALAGERFQAWQRTWLSVSKTRSRGPSLSCWGMDLQAECLARENNPRKQKFHARIYPNLNPRINKLK
jgi:hypothetical protein